MFFLRRQVKKCKIHKKLKLRMDGDGVECQMGTEFSGFFAREKATELRPHLALNSVPIWQTGLVKFNDSGCFYQSNHVL